MLTHKKKYLSLAVCASLSLGSTVFAQESKNNSETESNSEKESNLQLEVIEVTATRVATSLQVTPVAVTALYGDDLKSKNIVNLQDISKFIPSLTIGNRSGRGSASGAVTIRGMGVEALDSSAAVGTYIDDVFFASAAGNILGLMDVERIEVLRGPQGTLFGRNTIAGAIQYVTASPGDEFGGYVSATTGSFDRKDFAVAVDLPVNDMLKFRIAGQSNDFGGYVYDELNDTNLGKDKSTILRVKAAIDPTDDLSIDLKIEHIKQDQKGRPSLITSYNNNAQLVGLANDLSIIAGLGPQQFTDDQLATNLNPGSFSSPGFNSPDYFKFEADIYQANVNYTISDKLTFKSITSKSDYYSDQVQDFDISPIDILDVVWSPTNTDVFTQEFQLNGSFDNLNFTSGIYYYDSERKNVPGQINIVGPRPSQLPASSAGPTRVTAESLALYGQLVYSLSDALGITLGYRYTNEDTSSTIIDISDPVKFTFTDSSPLLGIDYQATDDIFIYAKASKGFRAGGFTPSQSLPNGGISFDPEEAWTYELGSRMDLIDGRFRVNPTVFFTDWSDIQFLDFYEVINPITSNSGDAEIFGIEIESKFLVTENLVLTSAFSYLDAKYTSIKEFTKTIYPTGYTIFAPVTDTYQETTINLDTPLPWTPDYKFSIGAEHITNLESGAYIKTTLDYAWTDDFRSLSNVDGALIESYGLLGARVTYVSPDETWSVAAYGNNLTNEFYLLGGQDYGSAYSAGHNQIDPGRPREIGITFTYNFGM